MLSRIAAHFRGNVVGYLALVVALSGTAYAAGKINGKQIKPNSIPGNRIRNGSLTGKQVNSSALGTVPNADQLGGSPASAFVKGPAEAWHEVGSGGANPDFDHCNSGVFWENFAASVDSTAAFFHDQTGIVHLKGVVGCQGIPGGGAMPIFNLPAGYRPLGNSFVPLDVNGSGNNELAILHDDGSALVRPLPTTGEYVSLDGISFRCGPSGSNGCP
jgi:hypothetical protein